MFSRFGKSLATIGWTCLQKIEKKFLFPCHPLRQPFPSLCAQKRVSVVYYEEIKELCNHPEKLLIDVRDPNEVKFSKIPLSINIPLCELKHELSLGDCGSDIFQKKYGRPKPIAHTYIIMYCRTGQRAELAVQIAITMGYTNVHNYCGSWLDYVQKETCK